MQILATHLRARIHSEHGARIEAENKARMYFKWTQQTKTVVRRVLSTILEPSLFHREKMTSYNHRSQHFDIRYRHTLGPHRLVTLRETVDEYPSKHLWRNLSSNRHAALCAA